VSAAVERPPSPGSADTAALRQRLDTARSEIEAALTEASQAANTIITQAETLLALSKDARVDAAGIGIMEACSFQDLTGQRLRKALAALERIMVEIERKEYGLGLLEDDPAYAQWREANLCHGPAAAAEALGQSAVDELFKATPKSAR
jgi:chemotaxis protein CheZ